MMVMGRADVEPPPWLGRLEFVVRSRLGYPLGRAAIDVRADTVEVRFGRLHAVALRSHVAAWLADPGGRPLVVDDVAWVLEEGRPALILGDVTNITAVPRLLPAELTMQLRKFL